MTPHPLHRRGMKPTCPASINTSSPATGDDAESSAVDNRDFGYDVDVSLPHRPSEEVRLPGARSVPGRFWGTRASAIAHHGARHQKG